MDTINEFKEDWIAKKINARHEPIAKLNKDPTVMVYQKKFAV